MNFLFTAFGGAGLITKLIVVVALAGTLLGAYGVWHHKVYSKGYDAAIADVAANNRKAVARAKALRATANDCNDRGGAWDQANAKCL